jgi:hypothetical protein
LFVAPIDLPNDADTLARQITDACGPVGALIHLAPLAVTPPLNCPRGRAAWEHRLSCETRALFLLARSFGASLEHAAGQGSRSSSPQPRWAELFASGRPSPARVFQSRWRRGFMKCVAIEWPQVRVRVVDLDAVEPVAVLADHVIAELWSRDSHAGKSGTAAAGAAVEACAARRPARSLVYDPE